MVCLPATGMHIKNTKIVLTWNFLKKIYSFVKQYTTFRIITNSAADKVSSNSLSAFE